MSVRLFLSLCGLTTCTSWPLAHKCSPTWLRNSHMFYGMGYLCNSSRGRPSGQLTKQPSRPSALPPILPSTWIVRLRSVSGLSSHGSALASLFPAGVFACCGQSLCVFSGQASRSKTWRTSLSITVCAGERSTGTNMFPRSPIRGERVCESACGVSTLTWPRVFSGAARLGFCRTHAYNQSENGRSVIFAESSVSPAQRLSSGTCMPNGCQNELTFSVVDLACSRLWSRYFRLSSGGNREFTRRGASPCLDVYWNGVTDDGGLRGNYPTSWRTLQTAPRGDTPGRASRNVLTRFSTGYLEDWKTSFEQDRLSESQFVKRALD